MAKESSRLPQSFAWLNITQFLGALNDNIFRLLVVFCLLSLIDGQDHATVIAVTTSIFVLPFLLFSHAGGILADRISKRNIIVFAKFLEAFIMLLGCLVILLDIPLALYGILFLMSTQSAIFGPSKYGVIPEIVSTDKLSFANGLLIGATYLAIMIGLFLPSFLLLTFFSENFLYLALFCVGVSVIGIFTSLKIEKTPAYGSRRQFTPLFVIEIFKTLRDVGKEHYLLISILAVSYFTYIGAFIQQNILLYGQEFLHLSWIQSGYFFAIGAVGIGIGALLAGKLSGKHIELGLVPIGVFGVIICCIALHLVAPDFRTVACIIFLAGASAGFFVVPLNAFIQFKSPGPRRGEVLACVNFLCFTGVALSAGTLKLFDSFFGLNPGQGFQVMGVFTAALSVAVLIAFPEFFVRFVIVIFTKLFYRIHIKGINNIPVKGPALLVANHVTYIDFFLLSAATQRNIRFVIGREMFNIRLFKPFYKLAGVIPLSPRDRPHAVAASLEKARAVLKAGNTVCIFAEGAITRNGNMHSFKGGLEVILDGTSYPIIPVHIAGAWGNFFSYYYGNFPSTFPGHLRYPITISFGTPLPTQSTAFEVRQAVQELSSTSFNILKSHQYTLSQLVLHSARRYWFRDAIADTTGEKLTYGQTLISALRMSAILSQRLKNQVAVGVMLPPSVAAALTNIALILLGKIPANLNPADSEKALFSVTQQCSIQTIITSRMVLEKLATDELVNRNELQRRNYKFIFFEDIIPGKRIPGKLISILKRCLAPIILPGKDRHAKADAIATLILSDRTNDFSNIVMLSHRNIISNIEAFSSIYKFKNPERILGIIPFSHSVGFIFTLWYPLLKGFSVHYDANPVNPSHTADMIAENKSTLLFTAPSFLPAGIPQAKQEDLVSLQAVFIRGGQEVSHETFLPFKEKFGNRLLEGYGAPEFSGIGAVNIPDVELNGVRQRGTKEGSGGHPLPGIAMKIVEPSTGKPLQVGQEGLLLIKGPNVMPGYLNKPEKTGELLKNGWYNTGVLAKMDADGFVFVC